VSNPEARRSVIFLTNPFTNPGLLFFAPELF
jgi:hypothetical protein